MQRLLFTCLLASLLVPAAAAQTTYFVDQSFQTAPGPGGSGTKVDPYWTVTQALAAVVDNDKVVVAPGVYANSMGEGFPIQLGSTGSQLNIDIVAPQGPAVTILDGEGLTSGFGILRFRLAAAGARLRGFTVMNYGGTLAAIRLGSTSAGFEASNVEITGCIIRDNCPGSGIATFGASDQIKIHGNLFINNNDNAIWLSDVSTNPAPGGGNSGGDVYNNTIVNGPNNGIRYQGGVWRVFNNIIESNANNGIFDFGMAAPYTPISSLTHNYNCYFNNGINYGGGVVVSSGDLNADPQFVLPLGPPVGPGVCAPTVAPFDYHLQQTSPCIDAANPILPSFVATDIDRGPRRVNLTTTALGTPRADIGADEVTDCSLDILSQSLSSGSLTLLTNAPVGSFQQRFASIGEGNTPIGFVGNYLLEVSTSAAVDPALTVVPPGGDIFFIGTGPIPPSAIGIRVFFQAIVINTTGGVVLRFTNVADMTICP